MCDPASVVKPIFEVIFPQIKRHYNYLCCFKNVEALDEKARTLEADRQTLQSRVDDASRVGMKIRAEVNKWLEDTNKYQANQRIVDAAIRDVQNGCWLNIILRYSVGRQAIETAEAMEKLHNDNTFGNDVALPAPALAAMLPLPSESNTLQCRKQMEDMIVDALSRPDVNIVGIWGIGGAGKTFTAKNVVNRMMTADKPLVDEAVVVVISQEVNVLRIQKEIAELVGLDLKEIETPTARANKLQTRLRSKERKIIVLDDIWKPLCFEDIGIPFTSDSSGCKILLTSRDKKLLRQMGVLNQNCFPMEILAKEDAWSLFRDKAGECVDDTNLKPTAEQVLDECKGLPLAIVTVGRALEDQDQIGIWKDALQQLKRAAPANIEGVIENVYKPLRLSYEYLNSEDPKSLFLLCCIFPEDFEISLEDLALYGMGLNKFEGVCTLSEARNRVLTLVEKLKSCALLLDDKNEKHVKMHDVVRDVARFIAREEEKLIDEQLGLKGRSHYKWAFIQESVKDSNYKIGSDFQCLRLLIIRYDNWHDYMNIDGFQCVGGMQELEVLYLKRISLELIDCCSKNLKTLELEDCLLKNLSFIGKLKGLEILKCISCRYIVELPIELGNLERLKLLDLSYCSYLKKIRAGVISKLNELEELKMLGSFEEWESTKITNEEEVERNASLKELESLKKLTWLEIEIANIELLKENISLPESIVKYQIRIGKYKFIHNDKAVSSYPCLRTNHSHFFRSWIHKFVSAAEELYLDGDWSSKFIPGDCFGSMVKKLEIHNGKGVVSLVNDLREWGVFPVLEDMKLKNLPDITYLCDGPCHLTLSKLVEMKIRGMPNLTAFGKGIESIEFPSLTELYLRDCPKFKWIDSQDSCNHDEDSLHYFCNEKVTFEILRELSIGGYDARSLWCQQIPLKFFGALEELTISDCHNIRIFCSFSIAKNFIHLKTLKIKRCDHMECVIGVEKQTHHNSTRSSEILERSSKNEGGGRIQLFSKLESLTLFGLKKFKLLSEGTETFELDMPRSLDIWDCPKFIGSNQTQANGCNMDNDTLHFFCGKQLPYSSRLREFTIEEYDKSNLWCQQIPPCFFQSLEKLSILNCYELKSAFPYSVAKHLLNLKDLEISYCEQMELVVSGLENETHEQNSIVFPSLAQLTLEDLPSLEMLCERGCSLTLPSWESIHINDFLTAYRMSTNEGAEDWNNCVRQHIMSEREQEEKWMKEIEEERRRWMKEEEEAETSDQSSTPTLDQDEEEEEAETSDQSSTPTLDAPTNEELHKDELHADAVPSISRQEFGSLTAFEVKPTPVLEQAESSTAAAERSATMDRMKAEITCPNQVI